MTVAESADIAVWPHCADKYEIGLFKYRIVTYRDHQKSIRDGADFLHIS